MMTCRCKTLDASADGYVRGEECLVALLTPCNAGSVQHSGAGPLALLCGTATNQDGRSSALTAPSGPAQQDVIRAALAAAAFEADHVTGMGTYRLTAHLWLLTCSSPLEALLP